MESNILEIIPQKMDTFSKGQKKLAVYVLNNYEKVSFMTAAKLGKECEVSESTVVRFASQLGFDGYPNFSNELRKLVSLKLDSIEKIELASGEVEQSKILSRVMTADAERIRLSMQNIDNNAFLMASDMINRAHNIYVVGVRSGAVLAEMLCYYLRLVCHNVIKITTNSSSEMFEQMMDIDEQDVIIGISFPRYSIRTLKCMEFANDRRANIITITDCKNSPINMYSSCNLIARCDMCSVVDSMVAPMSLINALVMSLCVGNKDYVATRLEKLENIWDDYIGDNKDEMNFLSENVAASLEKMEE